MNYPSTFGWRGTQCSSERDGGLTFGQSSYDHLSPMSLKPRSGFNFSLSWPLQM